MEMSDEDHHEGDEISSDEEEIQGGYTFISIDIHKFFILGTKAELICSCSSLEMENIFLCFCCFFRECNGDLYCQFYFWYGTKCFDLVFQQCVQFLL